MEVCLFGHRSHNYRSVSSVVVANGSPPLPRFFGAVLPKRLQYAVTAAGDGPRHSLHASASAYYHEYYEDLI